MSVYLVLFLAVMEQLTHHRPQSASFYFPTLYLFVIVLIMYFYNIIYNDMTCDFLQCGILTSVDSDEHVQPPFKLRNSK